jgi:hypothetical protein
LTTIAGLTPILLEKSFQAQVLIPMANSLCFGLALATVLVLVLVPAFFWLYGRLALGFPASVDDPEALAITEPVVANEQFVNQAESELDSEVAVR